MVQVLRPQQQEETFGQLFGRGLGGGVSQGIGQALKAKQEQQSDFKKMAQEYSLKKELEKAKRESELTGNEGVLRDLENRRGLEPGSLNAYINDPKAAEQVTRPPKEKNPLGGLGGTPLSAEESGAIENVIKNNPDASAEELELKFNKYGIPPGRTHDILESRRQSEKTKAERKSKAEETERKEQLEFHKEFEKYDEELLKNKKASDNQLSAIKDVEKSLSSGKVKPSSLANVFRGFGEIGKKISNALLSKDQAKIQASIPAFLEGRKELFGVRLSDADLALLEDKLPDMGKSDQANKAIINIMKKYSELAQVRYKIAQDIKSKNKGLRPLGYSYKIEERFDEMMSPVQVINPNTGRTIEIPAYKVGDAIKSGARLANE